jgi:hypothetical protein
MSHAVKGKRGVAMVVGATALAVGVVTTTLTSPASAVPASGPISSAILAKQNATPAFKAPNRVIDDPDGDNLPNKTPDGAGGYMFYKGNLGRGAIYAHPRGSIRANTIYGNILASWELRGWETGDGYPIEDERASTATDRSICGFATVTRVQRFARLNSSAATLGCYRPGTSGFGVTWAADWRPAT